MKKIIIIILTAFIFIPTYFALEEKEEVQLVKCIDGDTAVFKTADKELKTRFLAIDTPETKHPKKGIEPFGKESSNYTCKALTDAKKIILEFDGAKKDKYDRYLVWVFVDDKLLQSKLIENGLAKIAYLYDDYKYTDILKGQEKIAQNEKIGIWGNYTDYTLYYIIIGIILLLLITILLKNVKNKNVKKTLTKYQKSVNNDLIKNFKKKMK